MKATGDTYFVHALSVLPTLTAQAELKFGDPYDTRYLVLLRTLTTGCFMAMPYSDYRDGIKTGAYVIGQTTQAQMAALFESEPSVRELHEDGNGMRASLAHESLGIFLRGFGDHVMAWDATNYVEANFVTPQNIAMCVTMQKVSGKTPHQFRVAAEQDLKEARGLLRECLDDIDNLGARGDDRADRVEEFLVKTS